MQNPIDAVLTSTFFDKTYASNSLMRTYELLYPNGDIEEYLDLADWNYRAIIRGITVYTPYRYNGYEKFTTIMNNTYENTTCYRIVLTFNGFMHPYEIEQGAIIKLPDPGQLNNLITAQRLKEKLPRATGIAI